MINQLITLIPKLLAALGLTCLLLAGIFLSFGRNPENFIIGYQAEVLGNYAYSLLILSVIGKIIEQVTQRINDK